MRNPGSRSRIGTIFQLFAIQPVDFRTSLSFHGIISANIDKMRSSSGQSPGQSPRPLHIHPSRLLPRLLCRLLAIPITERASHIPHTHKQTAAILSPYFEHIAHICVRNHPVIICVCSIVNNSKHSRPLYRSIHSRPGADNAFHCPRRNSSICPIPVCRRQSRRHNNKISAVSALRMLSKLGKPRSFKLSDNIAHKPDIRHNQNNRPPRQQRMHRKPCRIPCKRLRSRKTVPSCLNETSRIHGCRKHIRIPIR